MAKRAPRLQFTEEDRASPELAPTIQKADKRLKKLEKIEAKIPKKEVKQRVVDSNGKITTRLSFEEKKPPSKLSHAAKVSGDAVLHGVHREVRQSNDGDNAGVDAANTLTEDAESAYQVGREIHHAHELQPYRKAHRAEKKADKANAATVITATPIDLTDVGYLPLGEDGLNFVGGEQTVKGFLHEQFPEKAKISRNTEEVQAESISYAVCAYFGIETGENSFGYIATWSKGKELPELKASLETINHTASGLITDIDRNYKALIKERGLDKEPESLAAEPVQEITVQEPEPVSAPDNGSVPDPAISVESMNAYGYTDSNMLPLTKERALELMERDVTVYMLHTDNTEAMAFDADEIRSFDGIFGVEASEWGTVKDRFVPQDYEKAFLDNPADSFAIYQLRDNDDTVQLHYMNSEYLEKKGLSIQKENYAAVYAGDLDRRGDTQDKLNELYETFNIRRPEDFRGHSLSVSDIVALKQNGVVSCHYVDSWGFKELPGFLKPENYLKNAEMAMEDDYGMIDGIINNGPRKTVAELEEQSKTGTPISLLELAQAVQREDAEKRRAQQPVRREKSGEKPSILAKLKTPSVADTKSVKSAPKRSAEREL
ncbi:DUF4316 domain-containing protein [Oscillospiraceae bacterium CLA-AA-H272]|jgi:hypothetical protein|uniref:DUF4316 domain-containing protein n=1 Tax=Brotocaccenecus cirricatena TaxID=3064195 RepID=A0AAE3AGP9_9FIRM|nr:YodL domain-containing protein [Brotocaccenecus cirricatena]MCC2130843.1 DUF4316 domain-containing protein [Brotocaccenecus cirricatena]